DLDDLRARRVVLAGRARGHAIGVGRLGALRQVLLLLEHGDEARAEGLEDLLLLAAPRLDERLAQLVLGLLELLDGLVLLLLGVLGVAVLEVVARALHLVLGALDVLAARDLALALAARRLAPLAAPALRLAAALRTHLLLQVLGVAARGLLLGLHLLEPREPLDLHALLLEGLPRLLEVLERLPLALDRRVL